MSGNNSKDSALSPELEHNMFIKLPSPKEKFLSPTCYQLKFRRMSDKQYPRKNRFRLQYSMRRSWPFDTTMDNSVNSNLDYDSCIYTPVYRVPILSRSAKIMKALSITPSLSRHKSIDGSDIRRLLNFDSTPSPKENNSYENSSSSINTPSPTLNSSLTDSTDSNVPAVESIDENQNRTPQQNRKHIKVLSNEANVNVYDQRYTYMRSRTSYLMSLLAKERKERTDKDANHGISMHPFCSFNAFDNGSNGPSRIITASTPRNLFEEFNQEIHDRPHTPENMIDVIPESISAIKKSHKKEKLYCYEEQASTHRTDVSVKNDLHPKTTAESSGTDIVAETSATSESESQMKNRNTKRTLIYDVDDERPNIKSTGTDLLESRLGQIESDEMQKIDFNDRERDEENIQANIHLVDDNDKDEEDRSKKNVCNEEVSQLSLQKESSDIYNVNATRDNKMASPESKPISSQNANKVVTPENHEKNMSMNVLMESIKKSHKKMKHENRKQLFTKDLHRELELAKSKVSLENACNDDKDIESQMADTIRVSSPQNFEFDRPSTPENVNSSRLLLLDFNSVKKSHKKDKRSKRSSSFAECHGYEYRKRSNDSLQSSRYEDENIDGISCRKHEPFGLKESPGISPKKKKKSSSMSLQSSTPKMSSAFVSLGCNNIDDEFKIYTPIKKQPILLTVTDYIPADEMSQVRESATSNEIDCSRCMTPIARFKELRKTEDLASERDNATGFETDVRVLKAADTANLKDNNGRSTPINMSTMELLNNIDSIKKSHKKNKHSHSRRPTSKKKGSCIQESGHVNFTNSEKMLEERAANHCTKKEICNIMHEKERDNSYKETDYDNPQPSTSQGGNIENAKSTTSKFLNTTPPNTSNAMNFIKLLHTTSIKKSHKKERDMNAQTKYIFMSQEHDLSDDGSIFDEQERLNFMDISDNNTEITRQCNR